MSTSEDGSSWVKGQGRGPRGTIIRYGNTRRAKRVRTTGWQWSEEAEEIFFDALAASCNVCLAASEAGYATPTVYRQRQRRPEFAARWDAALAQGYARLEMGLVQAAVVSIDGIEFDGSRPIPKMSVAEAMNLLKLHGPAVRGERGGPGRFGKRRTLDEVRASIIKKIEAIERADRAEAATRGETADRAETATRAETADRADRVG